MSNKTKYNRQKSRKTKKSRKSRRCKNRGGGCGCSRLIGGSANLHLLPATNYYKYNGDLTSDPTAPSNIVNSRLAGDFSRTHGGRRNRKNKSSKRKNKMNGGSNFFSGAFSNIESSGSDHNFMTSLGAANGSSVQNALVSGTGGIINSSVISQPVLSQPYGFSNIPLI